jgi:putative salt-induced outer membrane protein
MSLRGHQWVSIIGVPYAGLFHVTYGLLLFSLMTWLAAAPAGTLHDDTLVREVLTLERALAGTLQTRDRGVMESLLDEDFVLRSEPDIGRATWIDNALTKCWGDRFEITNFTVHEQKDARVATFTLTMYVNPANCQQATIRSLITDVWIAHEGAWRLRVRHSGPPIASTSVAGQFGFTPQPTPRWKVDSELSFVGTAGNTSTQTVGLASDLVHQRERTTSRVQASLVSSETDGIARARAMDIQARHSVDLRDALAIFGRLTYARDRFAGIDSRVALDMGVAYTAVDSPVHTLTLEAGGGITSEGRVETEDLRFAVATGTLAYGRKITPGLEVRDELGLTADLMSGSNWRAKNALTLQATLTRMLSVKLSHAIEHRHEPVPGFGRTDSRTSAALVFSFRKLPPVR